MQIDNIQPDSQPELPAETFWNQQYINASTGWDLGEISPPVKAYIDQLANKHLRILIPGCGNSYEAEYLLLQGFNDITLIDIAPVLVEKLKHKFSSQSNIRIIMGDFFDHRGQYDLIIEQTFFCALHPSLRPAYINTIKQLLAPNGKLAGVLFDKIFDKTGPPFGGCKSDYINLFKNDFIFKTMEPCYNSFAKRQDTELFIILQKISDSPKHGAL